MCRRDDAYLSAGLRLHPQGDSRCAAFERKLRFLLRVITCPATEAGVAVAGMATAAAYAALRAFRELSGEALGLGFFTRNAE